MWLGAYTILNGLVLYKGRGGDVVIFSLQCTIHSVELHTRRVQ